MSLIIRAYRQQECWLISTFWCFFLLFGFPLYLDLGRVNTVAQWCTEWTSHAVESHVFSASNQLNLSNPPLTGGRGPLIKTSAFRELTAFSRLLKSRLSISDCHLARSFAPVCRMIFFKVGFAATILRILSVMSETILFGKHSTFVLLLYMLLTSFTVESESESLASPAAFYLLINF